MEHGMGPNNNTPPKGLGLLFQNIALWCRMRGQKGRMTALKGKRQPGKSKFLLSLNCSANCKGFGKTECGRCRLGHVFQLGNKKNVVPPYGVLYGDGIIICLKHVSLNIVIKKLKK
jgi:hypothetical protein